MHKTLAAITTLLILIAVNWAIVGKEKHLVEGEVVYLELAPVDPRSLMQGDYMALRFAIGNRIRNALSQAPEESSSPDAGGGYVIVKLDANNVARFQRLGTNRVPLASDEMRLYYRLRDGRIKFATNAFFFQEGHAERYEGARYGQFRVDDNGEPLLVALHDENLNVLGEAQR